MKVDKKWGQNIIQEGKSFFTFAKGDESRAA